jgi:hypothetical protein
MNDLVLLAYEPMRGVGARAPESDELESGWMRLGGGSYMRINYGEPDGANGNGRRGGGGDGTRCQRAEVGRPDGSAVGVRDVGIAEMGAGVAAGAVSGMP